MSECEKNRKKAYNVNVNGCKNLVTVIKELSDKNIEIISTGGTSRVISDAGVTVRSVDEVTNFPEMMGGRVKTLHPLIFGGILGRDSDQEEMAKYSIEKIDMEVSNLYPMRKPAENGVDLHTLIEEIEIVKENITFKIPGKLN